jgi:hypothetical protein
MISSIKVLGLPNEDTNGHTRMGLLMILPSNVDLACI